MEIIRETVAIPGRSKLFPAQYFSGLPWAVLDIETLGLSPSRSPVILAGIAVPDPGDPNRVCLTQFFAEHITGGSEERELLAALAGELEDISVLVTYNGRSFDLPYLRERMGQRGLPPPGRKYDLDLYRILRDCTDLKQFLPNLKQSTVEDFAGLWSLREDTISGAVSISRYYDYLTDPVGNSKAKEEILLHNRDDILQLYRLTELLKRADMHKACYRYGFPMRCEGVSYIVKVLELKGDRLMAEGLVTEDPFDYIIYGDEGPSYQWDSGRFALSVPLLSHQGLVLADLMAMTEPPIGIPEEAAPSGYLVLAEGEDVNYRHCNLLAAGLIRRITRKWRENQ